MVSGKCSEQSVEVMMGGGRGDAEEWKWSAWAPLDVLHSLELSLQLLAISPGGVQVGLLCLLLQPLSHTTHTQVSMTSRAIMFTWF